MRTVHLHLRALPVYTPAQEGLFLAGNFNNWQPADPRFRFQRQLDGTSLLSLETSLPHLECKITRGHWEKSEANERGATVPNRLLPLQGPHSHHWLDVEAWLDLRHEISQHTAAENVFLLDHAFPMPELKRTRRIWAYLPPDYFASNRRYPVLYMQDGQNLFDANGSFSGEWGVDKALNHVFLQENLTQKMPGAIIIGIENGGEHRLAEYSPWPNPEHGGGEGQAYLDFLTNSLKPFVDKHLRTRPEREHTAIMGSSMGGLIALYAAVERQDVFGMAGVFSPSLWFSREIFAHILRSKQKMPLRVLMMAGEQESESMTQDLLDLYETLCEAGFDDEMLHYDLHSDGSHSEWFWAREFEHAFRWLFELPGTAEHATDSKPTAHIAADSDLVRFAVDSMTKHLLVEVADTLRAPALEIRDYCHQREWQFELTDSPMRVDYTEWEHCLYSIRVKAQGDLIFSRRVFLEN